MSLEELNSELEEVLRDQFGLQNVNGNWHYHGRSGPVDSIKTAPVVLEALKRSWKEINADKFCVVVGPKQLFASNSDPQVGIMLSLEMNELVSLFELIEENSPWKIFTEYKGVYIFTSK